MNLPIPILSVLIGGVVLFFGRRLFWLCVAAVGFAAGMEFARHRFYAITASAAGNDVLAGFGHSIDYNPSPVFLLAMALLCGLLGALLGLFLQKVAIAFAGFLTGGKLALGLISTFVLHGVNNSWLVFIVGGIIGAIQLLSLFDWALIAMSALVGAYLISHTIVLPQTGATLLFVGLGAIGIIVQAAAFRRRTVS